MENLLETAKSSQASSYMGHVKQRTQCDQARDGAQHFVPERENARMLKMEGCHLYCCTIMLVFDKIIKTRTAGGRRQTAGMVWDSCCFGEENSHFMWSFPFSHVSSSTLQPSDRDARGSETFGRLAFGSAACHYLLVRDYLFS